MIRISEENAFRILETALHLEMPLIKAKAIRAINKLTDSQCSYKQRIEIADKLELDELMVRFLDYLSLINFWLIRTPRSIF